MKLNLRISIIIIIIIIIIIMAVSNESIIVAILGVHVLGLAVWALLYLRQNRAELKDKKD